MKQQPKQMSKQVNGQKVSYQLYPLVNRADEGLRQTVPMFDFNNPTVNPRDFAISLAESMVYHFGVGLAAPQVGVPVRAFAMGAGNQVQVCFNPIINKATGNTAFEEGCLTFKGLFLRIHRPERIEVQYQDFNGQLQEAVFEGLTSRTFQHELDHLEGRLYTTLVDRYLLERSYKKVPANLRKLKAQEQDWIRRNTIQQAANRVLEAKRIEALNASLSFKTPEVTLNLPASGQ